MADTRCLETRFEAVEFRLITETSRPPPADYCESFVRLGTLEVYEALQAAVNDIHGYLRCVHHYLSDGLRDLLDPRVER